MEKRDDNAKYVGWIVYIFLAVISILASFIEHETSDLFEAMVIVYFVITIIVLDRMTKAKAVNNILHAKFVIALMIITAMILGFETNDTHIYMLVLAVPIFVTLVYLESSLFSYLEKFILIQFTLFLIVGFPGMSGRPRHSEVILFYLIVLGGCFLLKCFCYDINIRSRRSKEQEQSLDDMLRVVSVKCAEARSATKSKSDFLSNMSHEIRTPINAILGMNEMILRETEDRKVKEYATNIESSGNMLLSLINDILDFSKIESGKMELVLVEYQLSSVVNDLTNMIRPKAEQKKLNFKLDIDQNIPNVLYGDEVRVRQVITNILTNAVKYTDMGEVCLKISFEEVDSKNVELCIEVKDTGQGISEEDLGKLFGNFERFNQKKNRMVEGTGLGMAITKRILDLMQGSISVESKLGKGSKFTVLLKQEIRDRAPMGDFKERFEQSIDSRDEYHKSFSAPDARILVVDDNAMNLAVVRGLLQPVDIKIDTVKSGKECLELLRRKSYNLVLLDHMMPEMDGVETLKCIKEERLAEGIPIIALTANAVSGAREMYFDYGFSDYLSKPISGRRLEAAIQQWLPKDMIKIVDDTEDEMENDPVVKSINDLIPECIDKVQAMLYSPMGIEGVLQNIEFYLENVDIMRKSLTETYNSNDYYNYGIHAHALKSTSSTIGLTELSTLAASMEKAGKEEDGNYIKVHHEQMLQMYENFISKLEKAVKGYRELEGMSVSNS